MNAAQAREIILDARDNGKDTIDLVAEHYNVIGVSIENDGGVWAGSWLDDDALIDLAEWLQIRS